MGRYEESSRCCDKAIEIDPKWNNKGISLYNLKRYEEAVACYDKVIEIDSQHFKAWNNKGIVLNALSKYDEAIKCYEEVMMAWFLTSDSYATIVKTSSSCQMSLLP